MELAQTDPKKMFIESFYLVRRLSDFDLSTVEGGVGVFAGLSAIFTFPGISFGLSKKILEFCKDKIPNDDVRSILYYDLVSVMHDYYKGDWGIVKEFDDDLVNKGLSVGEIFQVTNYIIFHGLINLDRGSFSDAQRMVGRLSKIADVFENQLTTTYKYELNTKLLVKYRRFHDAQSELEKGIMFCNKIGLKQYVNFFYTLKSQIQVMLRDMEGAKESLRCAKEYLPEVKATPSYLLHFLVGQLAFHLYRLEESIETGNTTELARYRKNSLEMGKKAVRICRKRAVYRTETSRLIGSYFWLIGKQRKALKWWSKSTAEGESLGARLELSRTYMEVGKRLLEPKSEFKELNGIKAEVYLEKARTMFEEMDLQWDLEELERIAQHS